MNFNEVPEIIKKIHALVIEKKGEKPVIFDLRSLTTITDYFYIVSGWSDRQVKAIYKAIDENLRHNDLYPMHLEGEEACKWILMDYGEIIVHVFLQETREYYNLEHLWADAPQVLLND